MKDELKRAYWLKRLRQFQRRRHEGFTIMQWADMSGVPVFEMWVKIYGGEELPKLESDVPIVGEYDLSLHKPQLNSVGVLRRSRYKSMQEMAGVRELPIRYGRAPDGYDSRSKTFKWRLYARELSVGDKKAAGK